MGTAMRAAKQSGFWFFRWKPAFYDPGGQEDSSPEMAFCTSSSGRWRTYD